MRNVFLNGLESQFVALNLALSAHNGLAPLAYSSLRAGAALHAFGTKPDDAPTQLVLTDRLDALVERLGLRPPTVLKLDVDGSELDVLRGAGTLLARPELRTLLSRGEGGRSGDRRD